MSAETARLSIKLAPSVQPDSIPSLIGQVDRSFASSFTIEVNPLIDEKAKNAIASKVSRTRFADSSYSGPDFDNWYRVDFRAVSDEARSLVTVDEYKTPDAVANLVSRLAEIDEVESVHAIHSVVPPVSPEDDPKSCKQTYLDSAPVGVDARFAWTVTGGDGNRAEVVDLEQGWFLEHEDLNGSQIELISGTNEAFVSHGVGVLGVLGMVDNKIGGIGIAPSSRIRIVSSRGRPNGNVGAILDAVNVMNFGDVLLLEAQTGLFAPIETELDSFEAILYATNSGITVIEAAGNGGVDLDNFRDSFGRLRWNRSSPDFRDSGAVIIGAGTSSTPHHRHTWSTFGNRVDVFAWGDSIVTSITYDEKTSSYTPATPDGGFSGTSGASAIVAGVATVCQSIALARTGSKLSPRDARRVLSTSGTPTFDPAADKIGNMPNLRGIIQGGYLGRE